MTGSRYGQMSDRIKKALNNHSSGYNCAQAVSCVFAEELGMKERDIFRMTEAMGFGMGTMGTCGAVSAMAVVAGLSESDGNTEAPGSKRKSYAVMKEMTEKFKEMNGSVICRELKGIDTGEALRSCNGCIEDAVRIAEDYIKDKRQNGQDEKKG
jgi:C_GCAxxG_C_C family probable redox protein